MVVISPSLDPANVTVYTVNGSTAGSSSSLPDWLTLKRTQKRTNNGSSKRVTKEYIESQVELIQGFEFPEASTKIKTTRDGKHVVGIGTYKPQMRVWDLYELTMKFERHTDAEGVDFVMLSDDWTKSVHLQNNRSIELHTQGGFHYSTRIPRFGRTLAYHFPSCDTYAGASGNEVYRLNLNQGRFMTPIVLSDDDSFDNDGDGCSGGGEEIAGVNCIDINPAHQLLGFGLDGGSGSVQFYDPRSRSRVGTLRPPYGQLLSPTQEGALSVTALASRSDGLTYAVGTSTGHTLLYDIRTNKHFGVKDQGYGLPVKCVEWITSGPGASSVGGKMASDGLLLSADKKVVKIWDRQNPSINFASITPSSDLNHIHHVPGTGVLFSANESIQLNTYFIPQLGPAPRWAPFLENITEEMENRSTRSVYEDYKFLERKELVTLGLDNLIGTPALKPYMHGYFIALKLYETARLIANPFAYTEHREKIIKEKMDKLSETRIRSSGAASKRMAEGVKVNKALAEKIMREEERERKNVEKKKLREKLKQASTTPVGSDHDDDDEHDKHDEDGIQIDESDEQEASNLLTDSRFADLFTNPDFQVDESTREFALLNPSTVAQRQRSEVGGSRTQARGKTAVEDEDDESDKASSDDFSHSESDDEDDDSDNEALTTFDLRTNPGQTNTRLQENYDRTKAYNRQAHNFKGPKLVPLQTQINRGKGQASSIDTSFGQRKSLASSSKLSSTHAKGKGKMPMYDGDHGNGGADADLDREMEMTWTPSSSTADPGSTGTGGSKGRKHKGKGSEFFGAGLEKVGEMEWEEERRGNDGGGRTHRRKGIRSGSKNTFRKL